MSSGARPAVPENGIELTSAETCTVVHKGPGSMGIWGWLAADLTWTKEIGRSMGYKYTGRGWLEFLAECCLRSA